MERKFLEHSLLKSESSTGAKVPWNECSSGAKVLSMVFLLPGTKVQRNEKASYRNSRLKRDFHKKVMQRNVGNATFFPFHNILT